MSANFEKWNPPSRMWMNGMAAGTVLVMALMLPGQLLAQPCTAPASWFNGVPALPVQVDVPGSMCDFHRWSWATFIYLMGEDGGGSVLQGLDYYHQVPFGPTSVEPRVFKTNNPAALQDFDVDQAMAGALVDQNGQIVYYTKQINKAMGRYVYQVARTPEMLARAIKAGVEYKLGVLEIKAAWRVVQYNDGEPPSELLIPNHENFYIARFLVPPVTGTSSDGKVTVSNDTKDLRPATLALVGLHIAAPVEGHREFLWATFEHVDNAPACVDTASASRSNPATGNPWSFYPGGVDCSDCGKQPKPIDFCNLDKPENALCPPCNVEPGKYQLAKGTLSPSISVCDVNPTGGGAAASMEAVKELNESTARLFGPRNVLGWYRLAGTLWTTDGQIPVNAEMAHPPKPWGLQPLDSAGNPLVLQGSTHLENTTMETYFQGSMNCFTCHSVEKDPPKQSNIALSHLVPAFTKESMEHPCPGGH